MSSDHDTPDVPVISLHAVRHQFKNHLALDGVTFAVQRGELHGFVGPNGAGKTTSLKLICTLLEPQHGKVSVFGHDVVQHVVRIRKRLGYMPDHFSMYRQMTVYEYLDFFAAAYGITGKKRDEVITDVLELTDMGGRRDSLIQGLSRGMQQRVSLARVLVNDPDLLLLDEPASGLDPRARIELMDILRALQGMGKTIFISSHILSELAELCDSVTIIDRGKIKFSGPMDDLLEENRPQVTYIVRLANPPDNAVALLSKLSGVTNVSDAKAKSEYHVTIERDSHHADHLLRGLLDHGISVMSCMPMQRHLNQAFMDLTEGGVS